MKRFIVTSPSWTGEAEIVYNEAGKLVRISYEGSNIHELDGISEAFKRMVPIFIADLKAVFEQTKATVVEADFEVNFDMFWKAYNLKHNKIRGALRRIRFALQHKNKIFSILSYDKLCLAATLQAIEINALLSLVSTLMHL